MIYGPYNVKLMKEFLSYRNWTGTREGWFLLTVDYLNSEFLTVESVRMYVTLNG
jgi:hypothetical protein